MKTNLVKEWFGGITLFNVTIESKRRKLLKNPEVIELLRIAHLSGTWGESFQSFIKDISK